MNMYCGGHGLSLPCLICVANSKNRKDAEQAYTINAFDYPSNPVGGRDWCLWFSGWQAAKFGEDAEAPVVPPIEGTTGHEGGTAGSATLKGQS